MFQAKNIYAGYGKKDVLKDVSLSIAENKITVIMGANGAGKSTLLKVLYGLIQASKGEILLHNTKIKPTPQTLVKEGIFMIPQGKRVFRKMTVLENIELATHFWHDRSDFDAKLDEVLEYFPDLKSHLQDLAGNLSGGQQQMVALVRGLINHPKMVFLDEPSIGLSPKLINDTFRKIRELNQKLGTGFVIVEHNLKTLLPLTDYAVILEQGQVIYNGKSESESLNKMLQVIFKQNN